MAVCSQESTVYRCKLLTLVRVLLCGSVNVYDVNSLQRVTVHTGDVDNRRQLSARVDENER